MKRSRRLDVVARLANRREEQAAGALKAARGQLERQRLSERLLAESKADHSSRIEASLTEGSPSYRLKLLAQSVRNLDRGLAQVTANIDAAEHKRAEKLREWYESRARAQAIHKVAARYRAQEAALAERAEERQVDDRSASDHIARNRAKGR